ACSARARAPRPAARLSTFLAAAPIAVPPAAAFDQSTATGSPLLLKQPDSHQPSPTRRRRPALECQDTFALRLASAEPDICSACTAPPATVRVALGRVQLHCP